FWLDHGGCPPNGSARGEAHLCSAPLAHPLVRTPAAGPYLAAHQAAGKSTPGRWDHPGPLSSGLAGGAVVFGLDGLRRSGLSSHNPSAAVLFPLYDVVGLLAHPAGERDLGSQRALAPQTLGPGPCPP